MLRIIAPLARQTVIVTAVALALISVLLVAPNNATAQSGEGELSAEESAVFSSVNANRAAAGLSPLAAHALLNQAAQAHADDILFNGNYSHYGTDGTVVRQRVARTGYSDTPWVSENWVTSRSPESAMNWWMNDYIHRVNILTPRWSEIGVGAAINWDSGEMIFVTVFSAGQNASGVAVSQPVVNASSAGQSVPAGGMEYTVQSGDTLLGIAIRYGLDYLDIAGANGISENSLLSIGQVLHIPGAGERLAGASSAGVGGPSDMVTMDYVIEAGDTLVWIAARYGMEWQDLARMNGLNEHSLLQINDVIQVPESDDDTEESVAEQPQQATEPVENLVVASTAAAAYDGPFLHKVSSGDTLFGISMSYGVQIDELYALNGLGEWSLIQPGQVILLR